MIYQDIYKRKAVIVIDPHGDLIDRVRERIPGHRAKDTSWFSMELEDFPFGVNVFSGKKPQTSIEEAQAIDRVMHIFAVVWGEELLKQRDLPRYLRLATHVMLANPYSTLLDMYYFLRDDQDELRAGMLKNVTNLDIKQFWQEYSSKSPSVRRKEIEPLLYRLEALFLGRTLVSNIVGQPETTIDFRKAIENNEIILIKLPLKLLHEDAKLVGTLLVAHIRDAIFSFADMPLEKRPTYSIYIDEFQNFVSSDIKEIFAEGRKYGVKLCVAHQRPDQLPKELFSAALSAKTKICFRVTEAAGQLAPIFIQKPTKVRKEDISPKPAEYLLTYGHEHPDVSYFVDRYLRPVSLLPKRFAASMWEPHYGMAEFTTDFAYNVLGSPAPSHDTPPIIDNPRYSGYLDDFLYKVQVKQDSTLAIPHEILEGFSDCGDGYYNLLQKLAKSKPQLIFTLLEAKNPQVYFSNLPGRKEQRVELLEFLSSLRKVMAVLATDPIGEKRTDTLSEVTQKIIHLQNREALVSTGETVYHMRTLETYPPKPESEWRQNFVTILQNTAKYLRTKEDVERFIPVRLTYFRTGFIEPNRKTADHTPLPQQEREAAESAAEEGIETLPAGEEVDEERVPGQREEPEPFEVPEPTIQRPAPPVPASMDTMNILHAQMKAREIDPDTTILASLGEHYVFTIKQWMRLFEWGSYPRATQYFKELKDNDMIYRKDREGRGGKLVEGDWFFLLTKGANELVRRRQDSPLFRLEPNEAERASGDTLVHTYLVNEILIHLRLLERSHPEIVKIVQIDHERSMRRYYLAALADFKLYPDGFVRLLVPTPNGLKQRHSFLELQHTTQRDEANWKTKCRKYLELFDQADVLDKFFATRTPQVLVLTMDAEYIAYHKHWTEEVLAERGDRGRAYGNRFLIGAYDTGISDMTLPPEQFFCAPRFSTPFQSTPRSVFGT